MLHYAIENINTLDNVTDIEISFLLSESTLGLRASYIVLILNMGGYLTISYFILYIKFKRFRLDFSCYLRSGLF